MKAYLIQIDAWSGSTAVPVRLASHDDDRLCHLDGQVWWPAIATLPTLRYDFFDGAFDAGSITSPTGSFTAAIGAIPNLPALALHDARVRIWGGELGDAWAAFTLIFDGRVKEQPSVADGVATFSIGTEDSWLDQPLLSTYAGTGGAEGSTDLQGQVKPLALGAPRLAPAVLIDAVNNIYQISAYGAINAVPLAFDRLNRFGAAQANHASFTALKAATVTRGRWATSLAGGYVKLGAPADGMLSFHVEGDAVGGWSRRPGAIIARAAAIAGGTAKVAASDITALNAARPWNLSLMVTAQTTARDLIQRIAASVNAVAYVDWLGMLRVAAIGIGAATLTMAADGSALPPVASVEQVAIGTPYWKVAQGAAITWQVHGLGDIAFNAPLNPRGPYSATELYREGDMVTLPNGSQWLFVAATSAVGSEPGDGNTNWFRLADNITAGNITYEDDTPIEALKPAEQGATNSANPDSPFGPDGKTVGDVLLEVNQKIDVDTQAPGVPTGLALTSTISLDTDKRQIVTLKADWSAVVASDMAGYVLSVREGAGSWIEFKIGPTATHWEMRVPANKSFSARILAYDVQGNRSAFSSTVAHTTAKDNAPPAVPTALSATASFSAIYLSLTAPADADVSAIEIWENTSSSTSGRTLVATVNALPGQAAGFTRSGLGTGVTRWYWTRAIDTSGNPSGYTASVSATTASINYGDFQGGLEPPSSGASLPNPVGYVGPKLFFNTANKKLYRYDASAPAWTAETDGADIKVASLTGNKIISGEISTVHLASNSVSARTLMIADLSNLVINNFTGGDMDGWGATGDFDLFLSASTISANAGVVGYMARSSAGDVFLRSTEATASTGEPFYFEGMVWRDAGTDGTTLLQARWEVDNGDGTTTTNYSTIAATTSNGVWTKLSGTVSAPANVRTVSLWFRPRSGGTAGRCLLARPILRRASGGNLIVDGEIVSRHVAVGSLTGDRITAGTFTGDRFNTLTSLPGTITVGSTGVSIATMQAQADDPAVRVNAKSTLINPGKIVIAGSTTLSDWRHGGDNTKMDGGNLAANSVTANKVEIGARGISIEGLQFSYNKANNQVSWTAGIIRYARDNGTSTGDPDGYVNVNAGSATWASGTLFVYWNKGASDPANGATVSLSNSTSAATANGTNTLVLATYKGGVNFIANYGQTIIDGATIKTGSVETDQLAANSVLASKMVVADLSNLVINNWSDGSFDAWATNDPVEMINLSNDSNFIAQGDAGWTVRVRNNSGWLLSNYSPVKQGEKYYANLGVFRSTADGTISGSTILQVRYVLNDGTITYSGLVAATVNGFTDLAMIVTVPANAVRAAMWIRPISTGGVGRVYVYKPILRRASSAELIVNGSITADAMAVNSITAENGAIANLAITNAKIGDLEVSTLKIANEAITKSYYATLATTTPSLTVNAETGILSLSVAGVTAGEVLRVSGILRLLCPDDLEGELIIRYTVNGGVINEVTNDGYKFDSDGGAATRMAVPISRSFVAPSAGTYLFALIYYNRKSGTNAAAGTNIDVMRQRR